MEVLAQPLLEVCAVRVSLDKVLMVAKDLIVQEHSIMAAVAAVVLVLPVSKEVIGREMVQPSKLGMVVMVQALILLAPL